MLKQRSTCPTRYPKSLAKLVRITPISLWFMVDISILSTGWWFGTFGLFSHSIGNFIIPTDFHSIIFQRGSEKPPTSSLFLLGTAAYLEMVTMMFMVTYDDLD